MEIAGPFECFDLEHEADVGHVRRRATALAAAAGLDETRVGDVALVVTEAASNVVRHAKHGGMLIAPHARGVMAIAWDRGPGMNVDACMRDGMSTAGTPGKGLGAIARIASELDIYSRPSGTVVVATIGERPARNAFAFGGVCVPYPGETVSGDGLAVHVDGDTATMIVCDGLGHGPGAAAATKAVLDSFRARPLDPLSEILGRAHDAARSTRGAAAAVVRVDRTARTCTSAGVGNIQVWLLGETSRQVATQHGTLGQAAPRVREEQHAFPEHTAVILHSDGIKSRWTLDAHPGLLRHQPITIAATIWREFGRGRDDATVAVLRLADP